MNGIVETTLRSIAKAIEGERKQHESFFDIVKIGCKHRKMRSVSEEAAVYVCDTCNHFDALCNMKNCPYVNGGL